MRPAEQFELRDYLGILRRRWRTVVVVTFLTLGLALAYSLTRQPVYESSTDVLLQPSGSDLIGTPGGGGGSTENLPTELTVLTSRSVRDAVREEVGHSVSATATGVGATAVIRITATSSDPGQAVADANAYARTAIDVRREQAVADYLEAAETVQAKIDELDASIATAPSFAEAERLTRQRDFYANELDQLRFQASASEIGGAQVVSRANGATKTRPAPIRDGMVALVIGLMLGVAIAFLREYLDDSIKSKADLERATDGLTVVGLIPALPGWKENAGPRTISLTHPQSVYTEAYVTLRTSLQFLGLERPIRTLQLTSASAGEGKTTTLANLGVVLARAGLRVVVVCCDLRRPRIHEFFGMSNDVGFTSVLLGESPLSSAIQPVPGQPGLVVLPSGRPPPNPAELLSTPRAREVLDALQANSDMVLVDSPPVLPVADAIVLSHLVDATLLVARSGKTTKRSVHRAVEVLRQVDAPLVGTVINGLRQGHGESYAMSYGYGYSSPVESEAVRPGANGSGTDEPIDLSLDEEDTGVLEGLPD